MDRKLWEPLHRFESRDYLGREYEKRHTRSLNAQRAHEMGSCFTQGREYFAAASTASESVKPLLLYYGVSSLSRGITLFKNPAKREESLTPSHGLKTFGWPETLKAGITAVLDIQVQACPGTFSDFVEAVGNGESAGWLVVPEYKTGSFKNEYGTLKFISDRSLISLNDLLSREPELASEFEIANGAWGNTDFVDVAYGDGILSLYFTPINGADIASSVQSYLLPEPARLSAKPNPRYPMITTICVEYDCDSETAKRIMPVVYRQGEAMGWGVRPLQNGDRMASVHRMYITSYILGMLSRYFPSKWMSILRSDKGDISRSTILAAIARIENEFPKLARDTTY